MNKHGLLLITFGVAGCGAPQFDFSGYPTPQSIYDAGMEAYRVGDCEFATAAFRQVAFSFPARDGKQAESLYYQGECLLDGGRELESARMFRRVTDQFPRHPLAADALLRAGDAYAHLWRKPALDPSYGESAIVTWQELMQRFRGSPAAAKARLRIAALNEMFAEKEYKSGIYYLRIQAYDSAIISFKDVVANYPQSRYAPLAVIELVNAFDRIGYDEEVADMCQYLTRYYPEDSEGVELCETAGGS